MKHLQMAAAFAAGTDSIPRRDFLRLAAGAFGLGLMPGCIEPRTGRREYSVALLGDTHFDSTDVKFYHANYTHSTTEHRYQNHLKEHVRNAKMWAERMPSLIKASGAASTPDTALVLQMGDLVQGDCGNAEVHRRMLDDAFATIKGAYGGRIPLVTVVGNHDIRGDIPNDGALAAFDAWQPPMMAKELGTPVKETTFSFWRGPDVFIVVDFNAPRPDFATLKRLLDESVGARWTFVVSHGPAIPSGASRWFLYGGVECDEERRRLRAMLAARNAIVLSGHTHCVEFYDCVFPEGRITQFVANSVWSKPELDVPEVVDEGASQYGARCKAIAGKAAKGGKRHAGLKELVEEYRPFVKDYLFINAVGHYRLHVSDKRVAAVLYPGASTSPARTFELR